MYKFDKIIKGDYMTYLDYSATTPVNEDVLKTFVETSRKYIGNPNSLHKLGVDANNLIEAATKQIAKLLNVKEKEVIYTSGSSESNNMAIKGIAFKYQNRGKHIITTEFEHSSIYGPLTYLQKQGFKVDFVKCDEKGIVDLEDLENLLTDDTILVSICAVNSEIGIVQPLDKIAEIIKKYPKCFFHVDMTQALGKIKVNLDNIDLAINNPAEVKKIMDEQIPSVTDQAAKFAFNSNLVNNLQSNGNRSPASVCRKLHGRFLI